MSRTLTDIRAACAAAAPASTLLIATIITLALATFARFAAATPSIALPPSVHISETVSPGGEVQIAVEAAAGEHIDAYLPGLTATRTQLTYDPRTGYHLANLPVPTDSPARGWCTVRLTFDQRIEHDVRVDLVPPPGKS